MIPILPCPRSTSLGILSVIMMVEVVRLTKRVARRKVIEIFLIFKLYRKYIFDCIYNKYTFAGTFLELCGIFQFKLQEYAETPLLWVTVRTKGEIILALKLARYSGHKK
jgi:hypothetical protein